MDHIPQIQGASCRLPDVLYYQNEKTKQQDYDHQRLADLFPNGPGSCTNALFEQCLFFGTLKNISAIYDVPFNREDFISRHDDGGLRITTCLLLDYMSAWITVESQRSRLILGPRLHDTDNIVKYAQDAAAVSTLFFGGLIVHPNEHIVVKQNAEEYFRTIDEVLDSMSDMIGLDSNIDAALWDCVLVLCDALLNMAFHLYQSFILMNYDRGLHRKSRARIGSQIRLRSLPGLFKGHHWCTREIHAIDMITQNSPSAIAICAQIDRRTNEQIYDHSKCDISHCLAYQTDDATYLPQHTSKTCTCDMIPLGAAQKHQLTQNVKQFEDSTEYAPMVTWVEGEIQISRLGLKKANKTALGKDRAGFLTSKNARCVAISHVWANGMGNTRENEMHECQLGRLQVLANKLYPSKYWPIPFWIDTLCVPVFDKDVRKLAIGQMEWVYKSATKVLVMDSSLLSKSSSTMSEEEISARILSSSWARRLWTAQEGAWDSRVFYQFADTVHNYQALESSLQRTRGLPTRQLEIPSSHPLRKIIQETKQKKASTENSEQRSFEPLSPCWNGTSLFFNEMSLDKGRLWSGEKKGRSGRFIAVMRVIQSRTISKLADEPLVVASLLRRDPGNIMKIVKAAPADRYREIFTGAAGIHQFPTQLVFMNVPRYQEDGSRCLPTTMLSQAAPQMETAFRHSEEGFLVSPLEPEKGIKIRLSGFRVAFSGLQAVPRWFQAYDRLFEVFEPGTGRFPDEIPTTAAEIEAD